jgi:holdfast attachment protein HfaA
MTASLAALAVQPASAQSLGNPMSAQQGISNSAAYNSGYGSTPSGENRAATGQVRDENGNLIIANGVMSGASAYSPVDGVNQSGVGVGTRGTATAIGNSLNVTVLGNWNTVIVDSEQINNGDQNAEVNLNGDLNL